ncbi:GPP34 family phosphoprotein [bacterium]|nr:GPP34 family phosphoprotein [bacterium]MBU1984313.1 GPP34 family phosphoprotein [bacterium]
MSTLAEDLLILSLPDYRGKSPGTALNMNFALAAAVIIELMTLGRLGTDELKRLKTLRTESTGDEVLDSVMREVAESAPPRHSREWIVRLSAGTVDLRKRFLARMRDRGTVQHQRRRVLGLFPYERYYMLDPTPATRLRGRLREVLVHDRRSDPREVVLISLLYSTGLLGGQLPKSERNRARKRAAEISTSESVAKAVAELGAADAAVSALITTRPETD